MAERRLLNDKTDDGYEVSTVRTDSGGADRSYVAFGLFSSADYDDLNAWPFETMVFKVGSRVGLYHEPYADEISAREGHSRILESVKSGTLEFGKGVQGPSGTPTITPEEWAAANSKIQNV